MVTTGWSGAEPDEVPAMPVTEMLLRNKERGPGDTLEMALARSRAAEAREAREEANEARDPDEFAATLVSRGYRPGLASQLAMRLGDTMAELEAEREKIEAGKRRQEHLRRAHDADQITVFDIARMQDFDEGDQGTVERLARRAEGLRKQIVEAQGMISPARGRIADPVEAASRQAHETYRQVTRAKLAEMETRAPERPPFGSVSRAAGRSTDHTGPDCWVCAEAGRRDAARDREDYAAVYGEIAR